MFTQSFTLFTALVAFTIGASAYPKSSDVPPPSSTSLSVFPEATPSTGPLSLNAVSHMHVEASNNDGGLWGGDGPQQWDFAFNGTNYKTEPFMVTLYDGQGDSQGKPTKTLSCNAGASGVPGSGADYTLTSAAPYVVVPPTSIAGGPYVTCTPQAAT